MPDRDPMASPYRPPQGLEALEDALRRDLDILSYPARSWVPPRSTPDGRSILDVLVVGGGQSGLGAAFGLMRERVTNLLVLDDGRDGFHGPWKTFARMITLRTPKYLTGPDYNIPNLSFRAWYEAQHGAEGFQQVALIPKELWADYLLWYRRVLGIPVKCGTKAGALRWRADLDCFEVPAAHNGEAEFLLARKVVLATGIDGSGRWDAPPEVQPLPRALWAHTHDPIDFNALKGKRIGVLGAGASAFDNASVALEAGAGQVDLFYRRKKLPNVNPYRWAEFAGFLRHHGDLPDAQRWRFIRQIIEMGQLPPRDTFERARRHPHFHLHAESPWVEVKQQDGQAVVRTPHATHTFDFLIIASGFTTDLSLRPELAELHPHIALWKDRFTPPENERHADLLRHPYLGPSFEFQEKQPGSAPWIGGVFNYTFGCLLSLGFGGASISGMKYSLPRLVGGITKQLYLDDSERHFRALADYATTEFET
ncbi:NAD(P)/FAD-dependent oxidoreductase [Corallococcus exercitus]|nr:NAD(P)/FAD-dependent oxidoreductase [Corallococcus exercitus]RKG70824.1 NAD(P)/FAD-dependent oxidoreductase [Corallococcus exercitus]